MMYKDEISVGSVYFYNNREVKVLEIEEHADYAKVVGCFSADLLESDFKNNMSCENEVVGDIIESIKDENIFYVPISLLNKNPVEYKRNQEILSEIEKNTKNNDELKSSLNQSQKELDTLIQEKESILKLISDKKHEIENLENECGSLNEEVEKSRKTLDGIVMIGNTKRYISTKDLLKLIESDIIMDRLEVGGVDNWTYYSDSINGMDEKLEDPKIEAESYLLSFSEIE